MSQVSERPPAASFSVLLYSLNYEPELTGIGKYSGELAHWLVARGHQVQVLTAPPYYPEWAVWPGYSAWRYRSERGPAPSGLRVLRCPLWVPRKVTALRRIVHLASFAFTSGFGLLACLLRQRPSAIVLVVPTLVCAPAALLAGWLFRVPVWLHVQDFEIDAMHAMGLAGSGQGARRLIARAESWVMQRFDRVSSISGNMVKRLAAKGVPVSRTLHFPNWVDVSAICPKPLGEVSNPVRQKFTLPPGAVLVLYAGNMGQKQGLEIVIEAARLLANHPTIRFGMVGAGAALADLKAQAEGLPHVQWLPLQPLELLNDLLNAADIHVLPQRADAADLVMPSKLTGMLASGRPVLGTAAADTQLGAVLDECGVRVEPADVAALVRSLEALAADVQERERLGALGRTYALTHLSHDAVLRAFERDMQDLVQGGRV